jgi:hypothetical protein
VEISLKYLVSDERFSENQTHFKLFSSIVIISRTDRRRSDTLQGLQTDHRSSDKAVAPD